IRAGHLGLALSGPLVGRHPVVASGVFHLLDDQERQEPGHPQPKTGADDAWHGQARAPGTGSAWPDRWAPPPWEGINGRPRESLRAEENEGRRRPEGEE